MYDCFINRGQAKYNTVPQTSNKKSTQGRYDHPRFLTLVSPCNNQFFTSTMKIS